MPLILTQHDNRCPLGNDSDSSTVRAAFIPKPARPPRSAFPIHYASLCSSLLPPFEETSPLLVRKPNVPCSRLRWFSNVLTPTLSPLSRPRPGQPKWNCASRVSRPARLLGGPPSSPLVPARLRPTPPPGRCPPLRPEVPHLGRACPGPVAPADGPSHLPARSLVALSVAAVPTSAPSVPVRRLCFSWGRSRHRAEAARPPLLPAEHRPDGARRTCRGDGGGPSARRAARPGRPLRPPSAHRRGLRCPRGPRAVSDSGAAWSRQSPPLRWHPGPGRASAALPSGPRLLPGSVNQVVARRRVWRELCYNSLWCSS